MQAEGTVNGAEFYFRARHNEWWFMMDGEVLFHAPWGARDFAAGYMPEEEAENIIGGCCRAWAIEQDRAGE
ncbi:MAG: hypothetical protein GY845_25780 [Planctomycetes bacterium]|nr:hypothetical protein [Planctomycetota bacterium]